MDFAPGAKSHGDAGPPMDFAPEQHNLVYTGMDFVYPAPLFLHNAEFDQEGRASSSFSGRASNWGPDCVMPHGLRPYCPGELLTRTALLAADLPPSPGSTTVSSLPPSEKKDLARREFGDIDRTLGGTEVRNSCLKMIQEPLSQCSTADTAHEAEDRRLSSSPSSPLIEYEGVPADSELGSATLPTVGSTAHYFNQCKPCAFVYKEGSCCESGVGCEYCHLCQPGERKRRKRTKNATVKAMRQLQNQMQIAPCFKVPVCMLPVWHGYMGQ